MWSIKGAVGVYEESVHYEFESQSLSVTGLFLIALPHNRTPKGLLEAIATYAFSIRTLKANLIYRFPSHLTGNQPILYHGLITGGDTYLWQHSFTGNGS